jgi:probable F420-dependent oxidoreductase
LADWVPDPRIAYDPSADLNGSRSGVEFGIGIPQVRAGQLADVEGLHRFLARAEELGFESAWVLEQPIGTVATLEPVTLLAHAAAVTRRIRLGTAVILLPLRIPVVLAKELATVDQLSEGRLVVGLALGGERERYRVFGLSPEGRVRRFEEAVRLLKLLWSEASVTFHGEFWQLDEVAVEPKPVQRPHPPVWFGGGTPAAVRRAARMADGWIGAGSSSTEEFRVAWTVLQESLEAEGRDPSAFGVAKRVYVAVDSDPKRVRSRLARWFTSFYGNPDLADRVAVFGPPDACAAGLAAVTEAGAGLVVLNPVFDQEEQAEALAAEVLPILATEMPR